MAAPSNELQSIRNKIPGDDLKTERYKYVLTEIHALNDNVHKYLNLFQTLSTAVTGAGVAVFVSWKKLNITPEIARAALQGLVGLLVILSLFTIVSILAGIFSWIDYRREEVELLNALIGVGFRRPPSAKNVWRWNEAWIILFVIVVSTAMVWFAEVHVLPLIR